MANNKNRKLSGVVLTGALVAPAVMSAAQQNVVSADFSSFLSSAKELGSLALKGAGSFFNTRKGQIVAVVAFVGLGYGLFCLLKKGYEYIRNKTTDSKFDDTAQKYQTDKAGYQQFIEELRNAGKGDKELNMQTSEMQDKVTITLTKSGKSLKIVANFDGNNFKKINFSRENGTLTEVSDDFANNLAENLNSFFKNAKIPVVAKTGVSSKEVADVKKIRFESTVKLNKSKDDAFNIINKDDEEGNGNQEAKNEDYARFIKNIQENTKNVKGLEFESENKDKNVTEIVLKGKEGKKSSLTIEITDTNGDEILLDDKVIRVKKSLENKNATEPLAVKVTAEELVKELNDFFTENNINLSSSIDENKKGFGDITFKKDSQAMKKEIKKEDIKKAIEESTTKKKIQAHVKNLIENKVKNKNKNIKTENIKIEVKDEDIAAIKKKIKVKDYLESNNIKQDIEEAVKKAVEDEYGKKVDEEIDKYNLVKKGLKNVMVQKLEPGDRSVYYTLSEAGRLLNKIYKKLNLDNLKFKNKDIKEVEEHIQKVIENDVGVSEEINIELGHGSLYSQVRSYVEKDLDYTYRSMDEKDIKENSKLDDLNSVRQIFNIKFSKSNKTKDLDDKILFINYDEKEKKYKLTTDYKSKKGPVTLTFDKIEEWKDLFLSKKQK